MAPNVASKGCCQIVSDVTKNTVMRVRAVPCRRLLRVRAGASEPTDATIRRYALQGLALIDPHAGGVRGRSVLEFGPGDLLTSGLAMLAAGADSYTALDRFVGEHRVAHAGPWYLAIQEAWPWICPERPWPDWLDAGRFPAAYPDPGTAHRRGRRDRRCRGLLRHRVLIPGR